MPAQSRDAFLKADLKEEEPGKFRLVHGNAIFGFIGWDPDVRNLDPRGVQGGTPSKHLQWKQADITPDIILAPSWKEAREALSRVVVCFA